MATRDDIMQAIRNADAAGDGDSVRKLGAYLGTMQAEPAAAPAGGAVGGQRAKIDAFLADTDKQLGLPEGTSARQIKQESGFNPQAFNKSSKAAGLAQVIPDTLDSLSKRFGRPLDPYNTDDALLMHRELMRENLRQFKTPEAALRAYNSGWQPQKWDNRETNGYVQAVLGTGRNMLAAGRDLAAGAVRGAGSVGATAMAPVDAAARALGVQNSLIGRTDRREAMTAALGDMGADTGSTAFDAGKLGAEVAGTLGVGGGLARLAGAVPGVAAAAPNALLALQTSGMQAGTAAGKAALALRTGAGALAGGSAAALVNPEDVGTGAAVGAVLPPVLQAAGGAARLVGAGARAVMRPPAVAGAQDVARALGVAGPAQRNELADLVAKLRSAETLVPGAPPTVAQALMTPEASIMQRVVHDSPGAARLRDAIVQQGQARTAALEGVAPTNAGGLSQAREDLGQTVERYVVPEQRRLSAQVSKLYSAIDPQQRVRLGLPLDEMQGSLDKYLGRGSFGQGNKAQQALDEATDIGMLRGPTTTKTVLQATDKGAAKRMPVTVEVPGEMQNTPVKWQEAQRLRTSIGDAWQEAKDKGRTQEAGALNEMRRGLDAVIDNAAAGQGKPGDVMPETAAAAWREANKSFAALQDRFHTGPQASIFRKGGDGQPAKQGGEIAAAFWGNRPGLASDVESFQRMVGDSPALLGQFRSLITTHGAAGADAAGNLTTKFSKWVDQTLPGLRNAFSADEVQTLQRIAADIDRAAKAQKLGTSLGGSNTYQNSANALNLGLLDNPMLGRAASMIPGVRMVAAPALEGLRGFARNAKSTRMAGVLADSGEAANALQKLLDAAPPGSLTENELLQLLGRTTLRAAPAALGPGSSR